jgi:hypothetical protein
VSCKEEERMRMQYNEKTQFEFGRSISPSSERTQKKKMKDNFITRQDHFYSSSMIHEIDVYSREWIYEKFVEINWCTRANILVMILGDAGISLWYCLGSLGMTTTF